jgi:hypothetical protein
LRLKAEILLHFAGYKDDEVFKMDDISVFRRFFVMTNLVAEIIQGLAGGGMGTSSESLEPPAAVKYGEDPFSSEVKQREDQRQEDQFNQTYGFPTVE